MSQSSAESDIKASATEYGRHYEESISRLFNAVPYI